MCIRDRKAPSLDERTANPQSPSAEELRKLLREHVKRSGKTAAEPYIFCTAAWCKPCTELKASLGDPRMKDAFAGTYLITLDVDTWGEALKKLGFKYSAIPAFFEVDVEGLPTGRTIDGGAWEENIPANMAPPLKQFFKPNG